MLSLLAVLFSSALPHTATVVLMFVLPNQHVVGIIKMLQLLRTLYALYASTCSSQVLSEVICSFWLEAARLRDLDKVRWNSILELHSRFPLPEAWVHICRWLFEPSMSRREHQWQCCFLLLRLYCINGWLQGKLSQDSRLRWHWIHQQPLWGLDAPWRHQGRQGSCRIHLLEISWWTTCCSQHKAGAGCSLLDSIYLWPYFSHPGWIGVHNLWWLDPKANVPAT